MIASGAAPDDPSTPPRSLWRAATFGIVVAVCVLGALAYIVVRSGDHVSIAAVPVTTAMPSPVAAASLSVAPSAVASPVGSPATGGRSPAPTAAPHPAELIFQNVKRDDTYAHVSILPLDGLGGTRTSTPLVCERVYFAAGNGLCLEPDNGLVSTYSAITFGSDFVARSKVALAGAPSRARVSRDGKYGAATVFVFGHSYVDVYFSTETILIDMATGASLGSIEKTFTVFQDGKQISASDFNFWGITFGQSSDDIYATLRTGGKNYLIQGTISSHQFHVVHPGVECPSLSPDGTRIAFKKRISSGISSAWRLYVLDLATMQETPLAETRDIDDQPEWLDDGTVLYGLEGNIWSVPADGGGAPSLLVKDALSPAVVR